MTPALWVALVTAVLGTIGASGAVTAWVQRRREPVAVDNLVVDGAKDVVALLRDEVARLSGEVKALRDEGTEDRRQIEALHAQIATMHDATAHLADVWDWIDAGQPPPPLVRPKIAARPAIAPPPRS